MRANLPSPSLSKPVSTQRCSLIQSAGSAKPGTTCAWPLVKTGTVFCAAASSAPTARRRRAEAKRRDMRAPVRVDLGGSYFYARASEIAMGEGGRGFSSQRHGGARRAAEDHNLLGNDSARRA